MNRTLRNNQVNIHADGDTTQFGPKQRDVKEVFPLMKEVDCPYQAARWPMECQVRNIIIISYFVRNEKKNIGFTTKGDFSLTLRALFILINTYKKF